jgi:Flp pilus assembly protein TadG
VASARPNFRPRPARLSLRSLAGDTEGAALIEITLFMPILALMAVAIINLGLYFSYSIQVENAAQAGAQSAIINAVQSGYSSGSTTTAGQDANNTSLPSVYTAITVTPTLQCGCVSGSSLTLSTWTTSCATATCGTYVEAVASGTFTPFSKFGSFFPSSYSLSSTATVRVQ